MTTTELARGSGLDAAHHDGSELYVVDRPDTLGGKATLRVRVPTGAAERVLLRCTIDGEPRTIKAKVDSEADGETWWRADLPLENPVVRYRWLLAGGETGYAWLNARGLSPREVSGADDYALALHDGAPAWHASSVVYEIFPDRFARSGAHYDPPQWAVPRDWDALPEGRGKNTSAEWFGGDLAGIEQHLDHVAGIGANVLYLTPFFPAGSTHRYDASSFDRIDPLLGGDEALASLLRAARARGMRILGDLTLNHIGVTHEWFEHAVANERAPERDFFYFDSSLPHGYAAWLDVRTLPKLDWRSEELHRRMRSILRRWLDVGLDGWRIDVANMVARYRDIDLNHDVAAWTRGVVGDSLLIAEHGHDFRPDLDGSGWHGVMNYSGFLRPASWWLRGDHVVEDVFTDAPAPRYGGADMAAVMQEFRARVPWDAVANSWTLLDSHDTPRFSWVAGSRDRHLVGLGLQFTSPGVPMLYAGDELGLTGQWGEDGRRPMPWDRREDWDTTLLDAVTRLAQLRRSSEALARGGIRTLHASDDVVAYVRESRGERLLCLAARAPHQPLSVPFTELETLVGDDAREGVLPADGPAFHVWRIHG
ncbi:MAG TPA: glycoside hydrolase family 13 protein [Gaiellaceae bacterium]|nr:glycoside hydrolase family 13 protein [Gaiellaceae bacterium]